MFCLTVQAVGSVHPLLPCPLVHGTCIAIRLERVETAYYTMGTKLTLGSESTQHTQHELTL